MRPIIIDVHTNHKQTAPDDQRRPACYLEKRVSDQGSRYLYADTEITRLIRERIEALAPVKTQRQIAAEIGYDKPNILSMIKRGEAKVPLERLPALSVALDLDLAVLLRAGFAQIWPGQEATILQMVNDYIITARERAILQLIETHLPNVDIDNLSALLVVLQRIFKAEIAE